MRGGSVKVRRTNKGLVISANQLQLRLIEEVEFRLVFTMRSIKDLGHMSEFEGWTIGEGLILAGLWPS